MLAPTGTDPTRTAPHFSRTAPHQDRPRQDRPHPEVLERGGGLRPQTSNKFFFWGGRGVRPNLKLVWGLGRGGGGCGVWCGGGVVVVVVLTVKLMTCLWRYVITDAPNYGGRVPVDTTPGPAPVCRALKSHPISSSTR